MSSSSTELEGIEAEVPVVDENPRFDTDSLKKQRGGRPERIVEHTPGDTEQRLASDTEFSPPDNKEKSPEDEEYIWTAASSLEPEENMEDANRVNQMMAGTEPWRDTLSEEESLSRTLAHEFGYSKNKGYHIHAELHIPEGEETEVDELELLYRWAPNLTLEPGNGESVPALEARPEIVQTYLEKHLEVTDAYTSVEDQENSLEVAFRIPRTEYPTAVDEVVNTIEDLEETYESIYRSSEITPDGEA